MTGSVNVDDEIFWPKVREAVNLVGANWSLEIKLSNGTREARIYHLNQSIMIQITASPDSKTVTLIVP